MSNYFIQNEGNNTLDKRNSVAFICDKIAGSNELVGAVKKVVYTQCKINALRLPERKKKGIDIKEGGGIRD